MEERFQPLMVRLPQDLHLAVKDRARAEDRSMAQLVRRAIRQYLKTEVRV